jgi:hypothetical protein
MVQPDPASFVMASPITLEGEAEGWDQYAIQDPQGRITIPGQDSYATEAALITEWLRAAKERRELQAVARAGRAQGGARPCLKSN